MYLKDDAIDLALSGGGVKGIAYIGMFEVAEKRKYRWGNIVGVSVGALAGAFSASGCNSVEMRKAMEEIDFKSIQMDNIPQRVPAVAMFMDFLKGTRGDVETSIREFLTRRMDVSAATSENRGNEMDMLKNIVVYSKFGCLFDGDYLEEWVYKALAKKGIRTFGDLRTHKETPLNPKGYRIQMTGVDCNRAKLIILPDDMSFYGIEPDKFEVAKAVRISTCVPFAFKPVEVKKQEGGRAKIYSLVDGGVFDRFPFWLLESKARSAVGFTLSGGEKKKLLSVDTALDVLKSLISVVQDIGIPKDIKGKALKYVGKIDTAKVHYLDFNLNDDDKNYLIDAGTKTAVRLFDRFEQDRRIPPGRNIFRMPLTFLKGKET